MTSAIRSSPEDYLATSYRPDCDYVDGQVLERNAGEREHSAAQGKIIFYLMTRYPELVDLVLPEQRVQVKASRFRVPDVCILADGAPWEKIVRPPLRLCIEILSPEDTLSRVTDRIRDYLEMGVPVCWIIDPVDQRAWCAQPEHLMDEVPDGILRAAGIEMPLTAVLPREK